MNLKQLEYFVRVAELGSFTRAALALDIAQPALSRQVRLLEVELRQSLLRRNGRGAIPTDAGQLLLAHSRGILHQVRRVHEEMAQVGDALAGRVAVGLPTSVAKVLTVPLTRAFRTRMPQASLLVGEGLSVALAADLINGRFDIALLYGAVSSPEMELTPVLEEQLFLVQRRPAAGTAPSQPLAAFTLAQLATIPLVIPSRPNAIRMLVEAALSGIGRRADVALEIDGVAAILDLVADDAGSAVLSRNAVKSSHAPNAFSMTPIGPPTLTSRLAIAVSTHRPITPTQRVMLALIQQNAPDALEARERRKAPL